MVCTKSTKYEDYYRITLTRIHQFKWTHVLHLNRCHGRSWVSSQNQCKIEQGHLSNTVNFNGCTSKDIFRTDSVLVDCTSRSSGGVFYLRDSTLNVRVMRKTFYSCHATSEGAISSSTSSFFQGVQLFYKMLCDLWEWSCIRSHVISSGVEEMSTPTLCPTEMSSYALVGLIYGKMFYSSHTT